MLHPLSPTIVPPPSLNLSPSRSWCPPAGPFPIRLPASTHIFPDGLLLTGAEGMVSGIESAFECGTDSLFRKKSPMQLGTESDWKRRHGVSSFVGFKWYASNRRWRAHFHSLKFTGNRIAGPLRRQISTLPGAAPRAPAVSHNVNWNIGLTDWRRAKGPSRLVVAALTACDGSGLKFPCPTLRQGRRPAFQFQAWASC